MSEDHSDVPARIGRYLVIECMGRGGMGVVYAAYDPVLDRKVALKQLHPELSTGLRRDWVQREAQAMARVAHPNVVAVFDVVIEAGTVVISMELVDGVTLAVWHRTGPGRDATLAALLAAGDGLVAAHRAGIAHRDFTPQNVLVGRDGRVRVIDFGISGATVLDEDRASPPIAIPATSYQATPVVRSGSGDQASLIAIGTPRYLAPECRDGQIGDGASDQWSFCTAALELLGDDLPPRINAALVRGQAHLARDRWPELAALLDELRAALAPATAIRRRPLALMAGMVGLLGVAAFGTVGVVWSQTWRTSAPPTCALPEEALPGVDELPRRRVQAAWRATGAGNADATFDQLERQLAAYAAAWGHEWTDACRASRVTGEQSAALLDLRMSCLEERRHAVTVLLATAPELSAAELFTTLTAAANLPPPSDCAAIARGQQRGLEPPPAIAGEVVKLRRELTEAGVLLLLRRGDTGARARGLVVASERLGYEPLLAEALTVEGRALMRDGDYANAIIAHERAYGIALGTGDDDRAIAAAGNLVGLTGFKTVTDDWQRWADHGRALVQRSGGGGSGEIVLEIGLAVVGGRVGDYNGSIAHASRARDLLVARNEADSYAMIMALHNIASAHTHLKRFADALELHRRVLAIRERMYGHDHPDLVESYLAIAHAATSSGDQRQARVAIDQALHSLDRYPDPGGAVRLRADRINADVVYREGNLGQARDLYRANIADGARRFGANHIDVASAMLALSVVESDLDESAAAIATATQALSIVATAFGRDHPQTAHVHVLLGRLELERKHYAAAAKHLGPAVAVWRTSGAKDDAMVVALAQLGQSEQGIGEPTQAQVHIDEAIVLAAGSEHNPEVMPLPLVLFARAQLREARGEHEAARADALLARGLVVGTWPGASKAAAQLDAWVTTHAARASR